MTYIFVEKYETEDKKSLRGFLSTLLKKGISYEELFKNPDIHNLEITEKLSIGIEEVKSLQKEMMYKPFQEDIQIAIIHNSQKLTIEAQNAILKSLEESRDHSIYILHVNNEKNLLPTIRSRSRIVYSHKSNNTQNNEENYNILELDLVKQFEIVEKASEDRDSSIEFINTIENLLKSKFELVVKNGNIDGSKRMLEDLKVVQKSREKISSNCNRRLTLESMIIQLKA